MPPEWEWAGAARPPCCPAAPGPWQALTQVPYSSEDTVVCSSPALAQWPLCGASTVTPKTPGRDQAMSAPAQPNHAAKATLPKGFLRGAYLRLDGTLESGGSNSNGIVWYFHHPTDTEMHSEARTLGGSSCKDGPLELKLVCTFWKETGSNVGHCTTRSAFFFSLKLLPF